MQVTPTHGSQRIDGPLRVKFQGLAAHEDVRIQAQLRSSSGRLWSSTVAGVADADGTYTIDSSDGATTGAWLLSSMATEPPVRYSDEITGSLEALRVQLSVTGSAGSTSEVTVHRTFLADHTDREQWRSDLVANLFIPKTRRVERPILVLGGAWGEFCWSNEVAALLAASGAVTLALAYFDWDGDHGLPTAIADIPLEYVEAACDDLKRHPRAASDEIDIVGISKGAELALLLATRRLDIGKLVAYAPSSHVWESVRNDSSAAASSSWTADGAPLPFLPFDADDHFYDDLDKSRLLAFHQCALADVPHDHPSRIPVERIGAEVLLMSLREDTLWPSRAMGAAIARTLRARGGRVREAIFEGTGHTLFVPGLPANTVDDTAARSAEADRSSWHALLTHLGLL